MKIITLTKDNVTISIVPQPEYIPIEGNALASGDDKQDKAEENRIREKLKNGNIWAWCTVIVECTYKGLTAIDTLGCCSYANAEDFKNGGYYDDMVANCIDNLQKQLNEIVKTSIE